MATIFPFKSQFGESYALFIKKGFYRDGSVSIQLFDSEDGSPYATATTHLSGQLEKGEIAIKDWSENEGILDFLIENNIVTKPHRFINSGFVSVPICKPI